MMNGFLVVPSASCGLRAFAPVIVALTLALPCVSPAQDQGEPSLPGLAADAIPNIMAPDLGRELPKQIIWKRDNMPMMLVPGGVYERGVENPAASGGDPDEAPPRKLTLPTFYIDRFEITNAQYLAFCRATQYPEPPFVRSEAYNAPDQPVVGVNWDDAQAYAKWVGKELVPEAFWEKAARGTDGRLFPWGASEIAAEDANTRLSKLRKPGRVGEFTTDESPYGIMDMGGNVAEWTGDWYDAQWYTTSSPTDLDGPSRAADRRVLRGGSWDLDPDKARTVSRMADFVNEKRPLYGFRTMWRPGTKTAAPESETLTFNDSSKGVSAAMAGLTVDERWKRFEDNFRLFFEARRAILDNMKGEIASLYPASDRREVQIVNMTDRSFTISLVNRDQKVLVYDETVRVNARAVLRLPVKESYRVYFIEQGTTATMERLDDLVVAPGQTSLSLVLDLEGKFGGAPRSRLVEGKVDQARQEMALVNQTDKALVMTVSDMGDFLVEKTFTINPNSYVVDKLVSGNFRVIACYQDAPDIFAKTDKFFFEGDTIRQTIVVEPFAGSKEEFAPLNMLRSVFVP